MNTPMNPIHQNRRALSATEIVSQLTQLNGESAQGWKLIDACYDDGGLSGGTLERPALQQLLEAVRAKRIDIIVVYKVDRLTRSLADFAKIVEAFERYRDLFFKPFGEGSMRWALQPGVA